ncbi:DUF7344 domain-containing protein [Natronobacterium lacisalsi]|uniref:DUF7344 domain-containing protein n=1 Tax=Natronobacterium lacisalsi TaxID=229731 RepID=UPI00126854C1|nr:hypothetical protein [Halobiforma lacisalsi]
MTGEDGKRNGEDVPAPLERGYSNSLDESFRLLANYRRRCVLHCLRKNHSLTVSETARQIAAWERDCPLEDISGEAIRQITTNLYHTHLPKLENANLVEFDPSSKRIIACELPSFIATALELCAWEDYGDNSHRN